MSVRTAEEITAEYEARGFRVRRSSSGAVTCSRAAPVILPASFDGSSLPEEARDLSQPWGGDAVLTLLACALSLLLLLAASGGVGALMAVMGRCGR